MQRILSGLGITGSQVILASGCRGALTAALAASASALAAMADFRSRKRPPRSATSPPSTRPQLMTPLILKLTNFIGCPWCLERPPRYRMRQNRAMPSFRQKTSTPRGGPFRARSRRSFKKDDGRGSGRNVDIAADTRTGIGNRWGGFSSQNGQNRIFLGIDIRFQDGGCDLLLCVPRLSRQNAAGQTRYAHMSLLPMIGPHRQPIRKGVNKCWIAQNRRV